MGLDVFVVDVSGPAGHVPALVLHGFPTSSRDWHTTVDRLAEQRRVVLFDFPGYGLSDKPADYSYSLHEQADVAVLVARELGVERAHLIAHDMGTSVACELLARRERGLLPFEVASIVLMNGSVHIEMARLTPSQRVLRGPLGDLFARMSSRTLFGVQMRRIVAKPLAGAELDAMWAELGHLDGRLRLPKAMVYIGERTLFARRWIGALERLDRPALVPWGTEDPVAVLAIGEQLAREIPGARLVPLPGIGHYPQLEDPARTCEVIAPFLAGV